VKGKNLAQGKLREGMATEESHQGEQSEEGSGMKNLKTPSWAAERFFACGSE